MSNILIVTQKLSYGGAPKRLLMISKILIQNNNKVFIASTGGELYGTENNITFIKLRHSKGPLGRICSYLFNFFKLYKIIVHKSIDKIVCNTRHLFFLCKILNVITGVKYLNIIQGTPRAYRFFRYFYGDKILSVSNSTTKYLVYNVGMSTKKIITINNTVPKLKKYNLQKNKCLKKKLNLGDSIILTCIGRYDKIKGHKYIIKAISQIVYNCNYHNVKLVFMGFGEYKNCINQMILNNKLADYVLMLPKDYNVEHVINITDIAILVSFREGLSSFLLEVMSIGKAIVASDIPGNNELIDHNKNGVLVPVKNSVELRKELVDLINNKDKRNKLAINSVKRYETEFSFNEYQKNIISFFESE